MKSARQPRARSCRDLVAKVRDFEFYSNLMKSHGKGVRTEGLLCARGSLTFICFFSWEVTPLGHRHVYRSIFEVHPLLQALLQDQPHNSLPRFSQAQPNSPAS